MFGYFQEIEGVKGDKIPGYPGYIEVMSWKFLNTEVGMQADRTPVPFTQNRRGREGGRGETET